MQHFIQMEEYQAYGGINLGHALLVAPISS